MEAKSLSELSTLSMDASIVGVPVQCIMKITLRSEYAIPALAKGSSLSPTPARMLIVQVPAVGSRRLGP